MEPKEDTGVAYDLFNMLLVVLIAYQENVDAEKTLDRLRELSEKREGNEEIAVLYAKGLVNLINMQEEEKAEKTLDRLRELSKKREGMLWSSIFVTLVAKKYRFMQFELDRVFDTH